jgi:hypothetical protein
MTFKTIAVAALLCLATLAAAEDFKLLHCPNDRANCKTGCKTIHAIASTCVALRHYGFRQSETWECQQQMTGGCFELIAYPNGSFCRGSRNTTAVASRANYCDECKGRGPDSNPAQTLQKRVCRTIPGTNTIYQVDYVDCKTVNNTAAKAVCGGCSATAATSFPLGQCVNNYQGFDWRLEFVSERCKLMPHRDYSNRNCSGLPDMQDNIVLDQCNNGWKFSCPGN